jgi:hypothetical protein
MIPSESVVTEADSANKQNAKNMKQQKSFEQLPLDQKMQATQNLMPFAALTLMPFLRPSDIGWRLLRPSALWGTTVVEIVVSVVFGGGRTNLLTLFAVVSFVLGIGQRFLHKRAWARGKHQHTYYMGTSKLNFPWLPDFLKSDRRVERLLDPFACFVIGTIFLFISPLFGFWICTSAACLGVLEQEVNLKEEAQRADTTDGMISSKIQGDVVEKFEGSNATGPQQPPSEVSTGMSDDLLKTNKK